MNLKSVIFDFDGTLANLGDCVNWREAERGLIQVYEGEGFGEEVYRRCLDENAIFPGIYYIQEEILARKSKEKAEETWLRVLSVLAKHEREGAAKTQLLPHVKEALKGLRTLNLGIGVVSYNSDAVISEILRRNAIKQYVGAIVGRESCRRQKPNPDPFLKCAYRLGVIPSEALVIGDSALDLEGANRAGMEFLGVLTGVSTEDELRAAGARRIVANLEEISSYAR